MEETGTGRHGSTRNWSTREQTAGSSCVLEDRRKEEGRVGGNSSLLLRGTKIVPATWQESVQTSQIQEPCPFLFTYHTRSQGIVRHRLNGSSVSISITLGGVLNHQSLVYQSDGDSIELFLPEKTLGIYPGFFKKKFIKCSSDMPDMI